MKPRLVAVATLTVLLNVPGESQAVFVKHLIDDFSTPTSPLHVSAAGTSRAECIFGLGGTGGSFAVITGGSDIASDRGLFGTPPTMTDPAAMGVDQSRLNFNMAAGEMAAVDWNIGFDFDNDLAAQNIVLAGLTNTGTTPALLFITMCQALATPVPTFALAGQAVISLAPGETVDVSFTALAGPTAFLSLEFASSQAFIGTLDTVVANPEPATMALMGIGILGGAIVYRRRNDELAEDATTTM